MEITISLGLVIVVLTIIVIWLACRKSAPVEIDMEQERVFRREILLAQEQVRVSQNETRIANEQVRIAKEQTRMAQDDARIQLGAWKSEQEKTIRNDAITRSHAVTLGKVSEHLGPFFLTFPYSPKDARFVGSPIDFVVFDGLDGGTLQRIVFVEVKTGKSAALSLRERAIRDAIQAGKVEWIELRLPSYQLLNPIEENGVPQQI